MFIIENASHNQRELEIFARIQNKTLLRKQQGEITSSILSLKTNLICAFLIVIVVLSVMIFASDIVAVIFTLLKSQASVITTLINFAKIRSLVKSSFEELCDRCNFLNPLLGCRKAG